MFTGRMLFLTPNLQHHSTEGKGKVREMQSYLESQGNVGITRLWVDNVPAVEQVF